MTIGQIIGLNLKRIREAKDLYQKDVAQRARLSIFTVSQLELGKVANPEKDTIESIAKALETTPEELKRSIDTNSIIKHVSPDVDDLTRKYLKALEDKGDLYDQLLNSKQKIEDLENQIKTLIIENEALKKERSR